MAALEVVALYANGLPCTQNPGPQDPCAVVRWGAAERATSPHLGGEDTPVWNELLSFPLDAVAAAAAPAAPQLPPLRVSIRHIAQTIFQRDSLIATADVPLPPLDELTAPGGAVVAVPLHTPAGKAGGVALLRLRLRVAPPDTSAPCEAPPPLPPPFAQEGGCEREEGGGSFASWMSALDDLSASFAARQDVPEDPEHPEGAGPEAEQSLPRRARVTPAGAAAAAAEGLLPPSPEDLAADAPFDDAAGGGGGALPPAAPPFLRAGARGEELRDEADAPDADGEDERAHYYLGDLEERQDYGDEADDPYVMTSEDEREQAAA